MTAYLNITAFVAVSCSDRKQSPKESKSHQGAILDVLEYLIFNAK